MLALAEVSSKSAVWTVGETEGLLAGVTVVLLELAGFSIEEAVSTVEFDGLLAKVIVVVLGFATTVTVSTASGVCIEVTVVTPFPELLSGRGDSAEDDSLA